MPPANDLTQEIAQAAARLIAEDGHDYSTAKQKAARALLGGARDLRAALPDNSLIEAELRNYLHLYMGDKQPAIARALRELALQIMRRLTDFQPHLTGAVLNGTATEHSDVCLHLFTDNVKDVEIFLLNQGTQFEALPAESERALETLQFVISPARARAMPARVGVTLTIYPFDGLRTAPRGRATAPKLHPVEACGRANIEALERLLVDTESVG